MHASTHGSNSYSLCADNQKFHIEGLVQDCSNSSALAIVTVVLHLVIDIK